MIARKCVQDHYRKSLNVYSNYLECIVDGQNRKPYVSMLALHILFNIISSVSSSDLLHCHYNDVIMGMMASQTPSLTIVYSTVYLGTKKTSKLHITGLCEGNSSVIGELPAQRSSNGENVSICWRHHGHGSPYGRLHSLFAPYKPSIYPLHNEVVGGWGWVYWFHSVRPSVRPTSRVRSIAPTVLIGSISYLYILSSKFRRCVACKVSCQI